MRVLGLKRGDATQFMPSLGDLRYWLDVAGQAPLGRATPDRYPAGVARVHAPRLERDAHAAGPGRRLPPPRPAAVAHPRRPAAPAPLMGTTSTPPGSAPASP